MVRCGSSLRDNNSVQSGPVSWSGTESRVESDRKKPTSNLALCATKTQSLMSSFIVSNAKAGCIPRRN